MWFFIIIILIGLAIYVLGAKNGLPELKFDFWNKTKKAKEELEDRMGFLSLLKPMDSIKIYEHDDSSCFKYDYKRIYTVFKNEPKKQILTIDGYYSHQSKKEFTYDDLHLSNIIDDNAVLVNKKILRVKKNERNERKEENND